MSKVTGISNDGRADSRTGFVPIGLSDSDGAQTAVFVKLPRIAVVVNGVALLCRPGSGTRKGDTDTVRVVMRKEVGITVEELDTGTGSPALINGSDVLFTGSEIFVGLGEETNTEGALWVASSWPEYPCTPIKVSSQTANNQILQFYL